MNSNAGTSPAAVAAAASGDDPNTPDTGFAYDRLNNPVDLVTATTFTAIYTEKSRA